MSASEREFWLLSKAVKIKILSLMKLSFGRGLEDFSTKKIKISPFFIQKIKKLLSSLSK
jgi:hypothetical protein